MSWEQPHRLEIALDAALVNPFGRRVYLPFYRRLELHPGDRVLDVGAGSGAGTRHLARIVHEHHGSLTCLDLSEAWLGIARRRLRHWPAIRYLAMDVARETLTPESFDVAVFHLVLHDIPAEQRPAAFAAVARAIAPGGRVYLREFLEHGFTAEELRALADDAGLRELSFETGGKLTGKETVLAGYRVPE